MDLEVVLYLYVTHEPCNFCVQMLLHYSQLKEIFAPSDKQTLRVKSWPRFSTERAQVQDMNNSLQQKGRKLMSFLTGTILGHLYLHK